MFSSNISGNILLPWPTDAIFLPAASWKDTVGMWVKLNTVTLLVSPFIFLVGVVKVHVAGELFAEAESGRSLGLDLCPVEFGLDDEILRAPGICEVDIFQIYRLKTVLSTCVTVKAKSCQEKLDVKV